MLFFEPAVVFMELVPVSYVKVELLPVPDTATFSGTPYELIDGYHAVFVDSVLVSTPNARTPLSQRTAIPFVP